ncbi:hypothetical protein BOH78_4079 [Pichia kudriavzevii]|uniref:Uncharacterized protein n=1 Tax=Pichia kudriavzevii TaxID=4909 RepID=A0A1V2LI13_PICKU|nr:hypothetical protein BOH78_5207 [Pichia kudriavzevii]ONH72006.1 hypothetical protein BOH78_4079 [Pichia kudriavzevii]
MWCNSLWLQEINRFRIKLFNI